MDKTADHSRAFEDKLVFYTLALTWPFYVCGGLYIVGPVLAVMLTGIIALRFYFSSARPGLAGTTPPPFGVWLWLAGMIIMLLVLQIGHLNQQLGFGQTLKSTIGWAKGWALFGMFPLAGACLNIRLETVLRGCGYVSLTTLILLPLLVLSPYVGLPEILFVSPLKIVGGPGPEFFTVQLYSVEPGNGSFRWRFFAPWSPAAGYLGNMYLILALADRRQFWKIVGVVAGISIIILSKSRLAMLVGLTVWPLTIMLAGARRPVWWFAGSIVFLVGLPFVQPILAYADRLVVSFNGFRADSSRVRNTLGDIAIDRWWTEAPVWGHGVVERGPHIVEFMPIGSHHTWYGLLFVKGAIGLVALAIPLVWSLVEFGVFAILRSRPGRVGFALTLLMAMFTIGENIEILAYLMWPGLLVTGLAFRHVHATNIRLRRRLAMIGV